MNEIHTRLANMIDHQRLHHAFFFVGAGEQTFMHKKQTILFLASKVFAQSTDMPMEKIQARIEKNYHPDFYQITTDDEQIKVEQIQELIAWIYRAPVEGKQKIAVIAHAQRLNQNASNALLKTLEEPPSHATLILCAPSKDHLLQTLRSRMSVIQFPQSFDTTSLEENAPAWLEKMQGMIMQEKFIEKEVFETTQEMAKNRADLAFFFSWLQSHLRDKMATTHVAFYFHLYADLFDQTLHLENQIYQRYGNISLQLDRFFMEWKQRAY
ncbi:MAG: hypothetical protein R3A45_02130 [Bdellovibrionota bacterium]